MKSSSWRIHDTNDFEFSSSKFLDRLSNYVLHFWANNLIVIYLVLILINLSIFTGGFHHFDSDHLMALIS